MTYHRTYTRERWKIDGEKQPYLKLILSFYAQLISIKQFTCAAAAVVNALPKYKNDRFSVLQCKWIVYASECST